MDYYKRKFAKVWGNDPLEVFNQFSADQLQALAQGLQQEGPKQSGSAINNAARPNMAQQTGAEGLERQQQRNAQKAQGPLNN